MPRTWTTTSRSTSTIRSSCSSSCSCPRASRRRRPIRPAAATSTRRSSATSRLVLDRYLSVVRRSLVASLEPPQEDGHRRDVPPVVLEDRRDPARVPGAHVVAVALGHLAARDIERTPLEAQEPPLHRPQPAIGKRALEAAADLQQEVAVLGWLRELDPVAV